MTDDPQTIIDQQGWTDATLLELALEYIENQQSPEAWTDFLAQKADAAEQESLDSWVDDAVEEVREAAPAPAHGTRPNLGSDCPCGTCPDDPQEPSDG